MIHRAKGFGIVNKAEVDFFSGTLLLFSMTQWMLAIGSLVPLLFLNPAWTSGSSWFPYYWSLAWRILSITLLAWRLFKSKVGNSHEGRSQKSHSCLPENPPPSPAFPFPSSHHWWSPSRGRLHIHSQANLRIWLVFKAQRYSQWFVLVSREWCGRLWMENLGQSCDPYWKWKQNDQTKPTLKNSYLREETSLLNVCSQSTPFCWGHY